VVRPAGVQDAASSLLTVAVLRQHVERTKRAAIDLDIELMIGSAKELIESTAAVVHRETGAEVGRDETLSRKAKVAQQALLLHGSVHDVESDAGRQVKTILSSLSNIAVSIAEMRNTSGTGHGRAEPVRGGADATREARGRCGHRVLRDADRHA
jgi:hypothetical protein